MIFYFIENHTKYVGFKRNKSRECKVNIFNPKEYSIPEAKGAKSLHYFKERIKRKRGEIHKITNTNISTYFLYKHAHTQHAYIYILKN